MKASASASNLGHQWSVAMTLEERLEAGVSAQSAAATSDDPAQWPYRLRQWLIDSPFKSPGSLEEHWKALYGSPSSCKRACIADAATIAATAPPPKRFAQLCSLTTL